MAEYIIGNNDIVSNNGTISVAWEHTLQSLDTLVCPASCTLTSLNIRNLRTDGTSATVNLGIYDITSGVNSAPLLYQDTITVDLTAAGVYSVTGLSVDFSAHSGKTLAIAIAKPSSNTLVASRTASVTPRSSSTATTLADPFVQNDTNGSRLYGAWAVLDDTAPTGLTIDSTDATMQRNTDFQVVCSNATTPPTTGNTTLSNGNDTLTPSSVTGSDPYTLTFPVGDLTKQVDATGYDWTLEITP